MSFYDNATNEHINIIHLSYEQRSMLRTALPHVR